MISRYVSLYLVTVYLTTCHRNWLGRLKPGKWNDFETKWNTSTNKHRDKYPQTVQWVYLMTRIKGIFLSLLWNNLLKVSCTFFTDLATSKSAWSLSVDVLCTGSILDFSIDSLAKIKLFARYMGWCLGACGAASLRNDESCCYKHCQIHILLFYVEDMRTLEYVYQFHTLCWSQPYHTISGDVYFLGRHTFSDT